MTDFVESEEVQQSAVDESQADGQEALSSALAEYAEAAPDAAETEQPEQQTESEQSDEGISKALKGRIKASERKGYERGKQEVEDRYRADLEELNNYRLQRDAAELAEKEKISVSLAERLLRAERGLSPANPKPAPASQPTAPTVEQRAQELFSQAQTIEAVTGLNVMEIFNTDADVHQKIVSGQWDFKDVAKQYGVKTGKVAHVPAPARSTNQNGIGGKSISGMTDEEFERFDRGLDVRSFDVRR